MKEQQLDTTPPTKEEVLNLFGSARGAYIVGRALMIAAQVHLSHDPDKEEAWQTEPSDANDCLAIARLFGIGATAHDPKTVNGKRVGQHPLEQESDFLDAANENGWIVDQDGRVMGMIPSEDEEVPSYDE